MRYYIKVLLVFLLLAASAGGVLAHEVRPAYLELKQTGPETYDVFWKVPGRGEISGSASTWSSRPAPPT